MKNLTQKFAAASIIVFLISGCEGVSQTKMVPAEAATMSKNNDTRNQVIMLAAAADRSNLEESYRIGVEDLLEIDAYNMEEMHKTVRVNSEGDISLPLVGTIKIKGMRTSEVEQFIAKKLEKYIRETVVTVFIKEYKSQLISVVGAVKNAQVFAVTGQRYLLDMLMMAGGLSDDAGNLCYVIRPLVKNSPEHRNATVLVDLDQLLSRGDPSLNIPVFAGDIINIPKGGVFFVDGAVCKPGAFTMRAKTSLVEAISMAQGVNPDAALNDVRIFREIDGANREMISVDYGSIQQGRKPDIMLSENDIVVVPKSGVKDFFYGFINAMKGFVSFGSRAF